MKRHCIGFVRLPGSPNGWLRCQCDSLAGDRFCSTHRDALDGAFLGFFRKHGIFRDDQYTETQTADAEPDHSIRPIDRALFARLAKNDPRAHAAGGAVARPSTKISTAKARANWRRAAAKRSR